MEIIETKFRASPAKGDVTALMMRPKAASHLLVLGHGASSNLRTPLMNALAEALAQVRIATMRYNFPYSEQGGGRDSTEVCISTIRGAVLTAAEMAPDLPLLAGGQSFGGRMTSTAAAAEPLAGVKGLVFFGFPLHMPDAPSIKRADHLYSVTVPMLFLSGTRDKLAQLDLLEPVVKNLGKSATLHLLETADHSFKVLKRTRTSIEDVFAEIGRVTAEWASKAV
jgi:predicted alpha/beta-hydrolase family hydrolase